MLFQFECAESRIYDGKKVRVLVDIAYPYTFFLESASKACVWERAQNARKNEQSNKHPMVSKEKVEGL